MQAPADKTLARPRVGWGGLAAIAMLALSGCALREGAAALDIQVVGTPVDASQLQLIPGSLRSSRLLAGKDGDPWLAVSAPDEILVPGGSEPMAELEGPLHIYQLSPPQQHYRVDTQYTRLPSTPAQSLCAYQLDKDGVFRVSLLQVGSAETNRFEVGVKPPLLLCGQRTLTFWHLGRDNQILPVIRRYPDGSVYRKDLPWPTEANPMYEQGPQFFDAREDVLFAIDGDYHTLAMYIDSNETVDLGAMYWGRTVDRLYIGMDFDGALWVYDIDAKKMMPIGYRVSTIGNVIGIHSQRHELVTCDWDGLRALSLPRVGQPLRVVAPQRVLDATPCEVQTSTLERLDSVIVYSPNATSEVYQVRAVPIDGSAAPRIMLNGVSEILRPVEGSAALRSVVSRSEGVVVSAVCQNRATYYRTTPEGVYGLGVSDGWMSGQRFMERGRDARFSLDCSYLYFKEHAANVRKLGTLHALPVPIDPTRDQPLPAPLRLAYNVGLIALMPDGRLLASTDLAVLGPQNRLLAIDVPRQQAQALAWGLSAVTRALFVGSYFPGRREIIAEVRDGSVGGLHGMVVLDGGERGAN